MEKYLTANGIKLCYQDLNQVHKNHSKGVILLIAGLGEQLYEWPDNFYSLLNSEGYRVIRYDNRDIGLSDKMNDQSYTLNDMANDALGLLDALEIEHAHVVGMSMGGMIAQILTAQNPERINSLCLIMSTSGNPKMPGPTPAVQEILFRKSDGTVNGFINNWVEGKRRIDSPLYPADEAALYKKANDNADRSYYPAGYMRHLTAIATSGSRLTLLEKIQCPTLVLHGSDDPLIPKECGEELAKHIQGARLELIAGMGHNLPQALHTHLCQSIIDNIALG